MTVHSDQIRAVFLGDRSAWSDLVRRHTPLVWVVARSHRLDRTDAADVVQHTWGALAEHLPRLRSPERLCAWLVTTARRESLRVLGLRTREVVDDELDRPVSHGPEPRALTAARDRRLRDLVGQLPETCRKLLVLQVNAPELTHEQIAVALGVSADSVGRMRHRCLQQLRRLAQSRDLLDC